MALPKTPVATQKTLKPMLLAACLCALLTVPVALHTREEISADGLSYLEIAANTTHSGFTPLLTNGYWSPAYPALLAASLALVRPSLNSELAVIHGLDWLLCTSAYFTFSWFLLNLLSWIQVQRGSIFLNRAGFLALVTFLYSLLLVANVDPLFWRVRPDVLVEVVVYLAAGMCIRLSLPGSGLIHHILLGVILALAYLSKAALFPLSLIWLLILFIWPVSAGHGRKGSAAVAAAFLLASLPFVTILSFTKGRVTFGDTGRLNYAWYVNAAPDTLYWDARLPETGILLHPPKKISANPVIWKFEGSSQAATWPFWYDPSYWYDGLQGHFNLRQQIRVVRASFGFDREAQRDGVNVFELAVPWLPLFAGLAAFVAFGLRVQAVYLAARPHLWLFLWPFCAAATYACVHIEYRFLVPFLVLGWSSVFISAWIALGQASSIGITVTMAVGLLLGVAPVAARQLLHDAHGLVNRRAQPAGYVQGTLAKKLEALGIHPGDQLATVDLPPAYYAARLAGARYTLMLVGERGALARLPEPRVHELLATLRANGARALISAGRPGFENDARWVAISDRIFVRPLYPEPLSGTL